MGLKASFPYRALRYGLRLPSRIYSTYITEPIIKQWIKQSELMVYVYDPRRGLLRPVLEGQRLKWTLKENLSVDATHWLDVIEPLLTKQDIVFDVGTNIGTIANWLANRTKHVHGFEPHPENIEMTRDQVKLRKTKNITLSQLALSKEPGTLQLHVKSFHGHHSLGDTAASPTVINGSVPLLDSSLGRHEVRVQNELGYGKLYFDPVTPALTAEPRRLIGHTVTDITDHLGINSAIPTTSPNNTQGYEIATTSVSAIHASSTFIVSCELSLENDFWGAAVVALYKDLETTPRRVWNYALIGPQMGQMAVLSFVVTAGTTDSQTWRIRLGRAESSLSTVYLNRNSTETNPYGLDIARSYMTVTEIEAEGISY